MADNRRILVEPRNTTPALATNASPVTPTVQVRRQEKGITGAERLMEALSIVKPALGQYVDYEAEQYTQEQEDAAAGRIDGMTFEEATKLIKSGSIRQNESPWFQAAFNKQYGQRLAAEVKAKVIQDYNNFDFATGDFNELLAGAHKMAAGHVDGNSLTRAGYKESMGSFLDQMRFKYLEDHDAFQKSQALDNQYTIMRDGITTRRQLTGDASLDMATASSIVEEIESGGIPRNGDAILGEMTEVGQAHGVRQMLLSTAKAEAEKLGIEYREDLMKSTSEEAIAYQRQLSDSYLKSNIERYNDPVLGMLAYHQGTGNVDKLLSSKTVGDPRKGIVSYEQMANRMELAGHPKGAEYLRKILKRLPDETVHPLADVKEYVRGMYQEGSTLGIKPAETDAHLVSIAAQAAEDGDVALVETLLFQDRTGMEGSVVPSISRKREFAEKALDIMATAKKVREDKRQEDAFFIRNDLREKAVKGELYAETHGQILDNFTRSGVLTQPQALGLLSTAQAARVAKAKERQDATNDDAVAAWEQDALHDTMMMMDMGKGMLVQDAEFTDLNDKVHSLSVKKLLEKATATRMASFVDEDGKPDIPRGVDFLARNDQVYEPWKRLINKAWKSAVEIDITPGFEAPETAVEGFKLYSTMKARNSFLADSHVDEDTSRFFRSVELAQMDGTPLEKAMVTAIRAHQDPDFRKRIASGTTRRQIAKAVDQAAESGSFDIFGDSDAKNLGAVEDLVIGYAEEARAGPMGVSSEDAVQYAIDRVAQTHQVVRGVLIRKNTANIPANIQEIADGEAFDAAEMFGQYGFEEDDLVLVPVTYSNNLWTLAVRHGEYHTMVQNDGQNVASTWTTQQLLERHEKRKEHEDYLMRIEANKKAKGAASRNKGAATRAENRQNHSQRSENIQAQREAERQSILEENKPARIARFEALLAAEIAGANNPTTVKKLKDALSELRN